MASSAEPQHQPQDSTTPDNNNNDNNNNDNNVAANTTSEASANAAATMPDAPSPSPSPATADGATNETTTLNITLTHHGAPHTLALPAHATLSTLAAAIAASPHLAIPASHQKLLITPKPGLRKPPFDASPQTDLALAPLVAARRKFVLMGSTPAEVAALQRTVAHASAQHAARAARRYAVAAPATPARTGGRTVKTSADAAHTFHALRPLAHLPRPERSLALLERLRDDAGIVAAMRKWGFSVGLLTEMDPAMHTTRDGRTLGLNRNRGEVVELRLRTDAYDGYRDYKTIRRTLCHELAHNVWGEHDGNFWTLCREIEAVVERGDWRAGGRRVGGAGGDEVYEPQDDDDSEMRGDVFDHGGWTGGEFVLGGGGPSAPVVGSSGTVTAEAAGEGMSRREVLARAAEERARRARQQEEGDGDARS